MQRAAHNGGSARGTAGGVLATEHANGTRTEYVRHGKGVRAKHTRRYHGVVETLQSVFLPEGYPHSVSPDYLRYQVWDTLQALCSAVTGVLATAAVLRGVGVGDSASTAAAAAVQWVVRDLSGMVARIAFAWSRGSDLDANAKTWRMMADILNDIGMALELVAPVVPALFMWLASLGSLCKSITGVAGGATKAALSTHFACSKNLGDVAAKDGSQETAVSLVGMLLGSAVTSYVGNSPVGSFVTFVVATVLHLFCNYRGLRAVTLRTLNPQRAELVAADYARTGNVLTPAQAAHMERVLWFGTHVRFGVSLHAAAQLAGAPLDTVLATHTHRGEWGTYVLTAGPSRRVGVALGGDCTVDGQLRAYMHASRVAAHLREGNGAASALQHGAEWARVHGDVLVDALACGGQWDVQGSLFAPGVHRFSLHDAKSQ